MIYIETIQYIPLLYNSVAPAMLYSLILKDDQSNLFQYDLYLLFTNWVKGPYQEIQAQGFSYSPSLRGLFGKPRACISWYGTSTQLVNSLLHDPF